MADSEISALTGVSALTGTEIWHVVQGGNSRKLTTAGLVTYAAGTLQAKSAKGVANGYASLNASGQVPASQLPGGSDVVNYANLAAFPGTGVVGTIYIADDTDTSYLWDDDSNVYVAIASSGTLPSTVGFKIPVRRVATTNVNIATGGIVAIDGGNTVNKDRILLAGQTAPAENGIYVCNSAGSWTRATDADTVAEIRAGLVTVWQGTTYGGSMWFTTFKQGNVLNTSAMNWYRIAHYGNIIAMIDAILGSSAWQTSTYTDENARDAIGAALVAGSGITVTVNDAGDTITVSGTGSYTDEMAQDAIGAMIDGTLVYVDATPSFKRAPITGHVIIADGSNAAALGSFTKAQLDAAVSDGNVLYTGDVTQYTDEMSRDAIGAALVAGTNITITVNDAGDTITISASGGSTYTDEMAQDAVGAAFLDGTLVYDDAGNGMKRAPITGHITIANGSNAAALGSFTKAQLNTAVSDGDALYVGDVVGTPFMHTVAVSDETTALTTGTAKITFRMPAKVTLSSVRLSAGTAPTGAAIIVDVKESGTTIFSTKPQIAISAKTSVGGAVPGVISDASLADDSEITINIDQIGSTIAGAGLKVTFIGAFAA